MKSALFLVSALKIVFLLKYACCNSTSLTTGSNQSVCQRGEAGKPGIPGIPGTAGRDGRDGLQGVQGVAGPPGTYGPKGPKGDQGNKGQSGPPGAIGPQAHSNWKQCAWQASDGKDIGMIKECLFVKKKNETALRVFYEGALRVICHGCCKRWYFRFNGAECSPYKIEGVYYFYHGSGKTSSHHIHRHIEGYCQGQNAGIVRVSFWIGYCASFRTQYDGNTGWNSASRIVVEEVPKPQP